MTKLQKSASFTKKAVTILFVLFSIVTLWHMLMVMIGIMASNAKESSKLADGIIDFGFYQFYFSNGEENNVFSLIGVLFLRALQFLVTFVGFKLLKKILDEQIGGEYFSDKVIHGFQNIGLLMIGYNAFTPLISKFVQYICKMAAYTNEFWIINGTSISVEWNPFPKGVSWMLFGFMLFAVSTFFKRGAVLQQEDDGMI